MEIVSLVKKGILPQKRRWIVTEKFAPFLSLGRFVWSFARGRLRVEGSLREGRR